MRLTHLCFYFLTVPFRVVVFRDVRVSLLPWDASNYTLNGQVIQR